jgi:hypothetical protein
VSGLTKIILLSILGYKKTAVGVTYFFSLQASVEPVIAVGNLQKQEDVS